VFNGARQSQLDRMARISVSRQSSAHSRNRNGMDQQSYGVQDVKPILGDRERQVVKLLPPVFKAARISKAKSDGSTEIITVRRIDV
ncbi:MAG TPA: hypothetical protein VNZ53_40045, partial [Steroidobacteraceae bacterium]|nr:hypothetical protein [Steroidobacteraceae bacterium]